MEIEEKEQESSSNPVYSEDDVEKALEEKKAEIEARAKESVKEELEAEHLSEKEQLIADKEEKEVELEKLRKDIEVMNNQKVNLGILRNKVGKAENVEKELKDLKKQISELREEPIKAVKEEFIHENIGENEEDTKVFNYYYERLKVDAPDKESARKVLKDAFLLFQNAKGLLNINPFNKVLGTHGNPGFSEGITAMQKEVMSKFGVTDEMIKKIKGEK